MRKMPKLEVCQLSIAKLHKPYFIPMVQYYTRVLHEQPTLDVVYKQMSPPLKYCIRPTIKIHGQNYPAIIPARTSLLPRA